MLPSILQDDDIARIISLAGDDGFSGFAGNCALAAVAIKRAFFPTAGRLQACFNEAFLDKGCHIGHVFVAVRDPATGIESYWDADGKPKDYNLVESWGMLDVSDDDLQEQAEEFGIEWTDEAAETVALVEFDSDEEALASMKSTIEDAQAFERLLRAHLPARPPASNNSVDPGLANAGGLSNTNAGEDNGGSHSEDNRRPRECRQSA